MDTSDKLRVSLIWAQDKNGLIGIDDSLPWNLPEDLKHFKEKTNSKTVIMGSRTFNSIGKPLPNRTNIVLSNKMKYIPGYPNVKVMTFNAVKRYIKEQQNKCLKTEIMVIGGSEIYELFLPYATKLYITRIDLDAKANLSNNTIKSSVLTYFPEIDWSKYVCSSCIFNKHTRNTNYSFKFEQYKRKY